jgi:hypothetical protein
VDQRFVLNVAVREGTGVLELLSSKDQTLYVRRHSYLALNLGLDVPDGIGRLDVQSELLTEGRVDDDLHSSKKQVERRFLLNVRVGTVSLDVQSGGPSRTMKCNNATANCTGV